MSRYRLAVSTLTVCREPGAPRSRTQVLKPAVAAAVIREYLDASGGNDDRERFVLLALDTQNRLLSLHTVSVGTQSASLVDAKHILRVALLSGAASIIVGHNHPSGDPKASREDIDLTLKLRAACELFDIKLHDHIIVGDGTDLFTAYSQRSGS